MGKVKIFGAIVGYSCALIGFMTTEKILVNESNITVHIRKNGGNWRNADKGGENSNLYFITSAWMFDFNNLEPDTEYQAYVVVNSTTSNTITFETDSSEAGNITYEFHYRNYQENEDYDPSESLRTATEFILDYFNSKVTSVGVVNTEYKLICIDKIHSYNSGWAGLTSGNKIYLTSIGSLEYQWYGSISDLVHEFRHFLYDVDSGFNYASDFFARNNITDIENFYELVSFPTRQPENRSEVYCYRLENSWPEGCNLYNFFVLKVLNGQHVTIIHV